jgi:predicted site-specific integrase-resolvase
MTYPTVTLLSSSEAASILRVSHRSMTRWAAEGLIPAFKMKGKTGAYLFDADVVDLAQRDGIVRDGKVVLQGTVRTEAIAS